MAQRLPLQDAPQGQHPDDTPDAFVETGPPVHLVNITTNQIAGNKEEDRHTERCEIKVKVDPAFGEKPGERVLQPVQVRIKRDDRMIDNHQADTQPFYLVNP